MKIPELAGRTAIVVLTNRRSSTIVAEALRKWGIACFEESDIRSAVARIASTRNKLSHDPFLIYDLRECPSGAGPAVAGCTVIPVGDYSTLGAKLPGPAPILKPIDLDELRERMLSAVSPAQPAAVNSRPAHSKSEDPSQRLSILLAEDNPVNQKVACAILRRLGHRVDVVGTGSAAVQAAQTGAYDVVLMDIQMPEMDGFEATARIRSLPDQRTANLPIIALTAHTMEGYRDRCLQAGMDDYLTKPLSAELLSQVLNAVAPPEKKLTHAL